MKRILITGVSGFIGNTLCEYLSKKFDVYGASRTNKKNIEKWLKVDFTELNQVKKVFSENKYDVVVNLAAILANRSNAKDLDVFSDNLQITRFLIESVCVQETCHLVNFSSSAIYPNITGIFKESDEINPSVNSDSLYGLSKFTSEMMFKSLLPKEFKQSHLRVGFVYGEEMDNSRIHKVFEEELLKENKVTVFGGGERTIPQIHIDGLCSIIEFFINNQIEGTYNVAEENISLEDLAKRVIANKGNSNSKVVYNDAGNRHQFRLDLTRLNSIYNV